MQLSVHGVGAPILPHDPLWLGRIGPVERPKEEHVEGGQIDGNVGGEFEGERPAVADAQMQTPDDERKYEVAKLEQMRRHNGEQRAEHVKGDEHVTRAAVQVVQLLVHEQQGERVEREENERVVGVEQSPPGVERVVAIVGQQVGMGVAAQAEEQQRERGVLE